MWGVEGGVKKCVTRGRGKNVGRGWHKPWAKANVSGEVDTKACISLDVLVYSIYKCIDLTPHYLPKMYICLFLIYIYGFNLSPAGDVMADIFRFVYSKVCCCGCCRRKDRNKVESIKQDGVSRVFSRAWHGDDLGTG